MRTNRPYVQIAPDVLERVRQIDLLSYLREFEPSNLVKVKGTSNVYCTAEHDSLKISNGKWYWWSRGFGGYSALDYLIKVKEYDFVEAVEILTGQTMADWKPPPAPKKDEPKVLLLPPKNKDCNRVIQYLFRRGIDYQLIQECISDGTLYESADYHNAVFIGKDESGTPKYAALRSTLGSTFKQDASGSDKRYSFRLLAKKPADTVHLFEAAIDLLSYATYLKCEGKDYKSESLLSLSGVYQPKKEMKDSKIPIALTTFLSTNPQIKTIVLHLDNDKVGRLCTATLKELLQKDYKIVDDPLPAGKDFNDFLLSYLKIATYAHSDIAMAFATWISPEFQLYIMKDYRRLKQDENSRLSLDWNLNRALSKVNYRIHTDAVKENLIPPELTPEQIAYTYASEADLLNVALFGQTAKQWKNNNPDKKGNVRDDANLNQLLVLANMESYNAILIEQGKPQSERLILLRNLAIRQMDTLASINLSAVSALPRGDI